MTDTFKQIIPDANSVIRCLDPEMLEALESHGTFIISELLEQIKKPAPVAISKQKLESIYQSARSSGGFHLDLLYQNMPEIFTHETAAIVNMMIEGKSCSLLQPDSKGWQKGKIKLSLAFIPEETELVETKKNLPDDRASPLDEIRNSIAIESN